MMSTVMELNPTLQTVDTSPATSVGAVKMLESDVPVSITSIIKKFSLKRGRGLIP